jgi:signal transduction histidine kinase
VTAALDASDRADAAVKRADAADNRVRSADHLAALDRRLSASLDEIDTEHTIAQVALPERDAWAVVDLVTPDGRPVRLAIVHPDPNKRRAAEVLNSRWTPRDGDPIGYPAAKRAGKPVAITDDTDQVLTAAAHTSEDLALLRELGFGACLVVPIRTEGEVDGAITFVSARPRTGFTPEEIGLGERIAEACAHALRNARVFRAVDERRSVAEESNRSRTDALAHVTHELRTPLNAIGGYAELLRLGLRGPINAAQMSDLDRIQWNQHHLLGLIGDILNFVRIDTRRVEYHTTDVDLGAVTREVVQMLEPLFEEKQQRFAFEECEATTIVARADADRVRQIAINLITNATKYSPRETQMTVRCGATKTDVFVDFADQGPGIPGDQLEAIFEPFVQLVGGTEGRKGGVGLGLPIARQLARGMQGDLTVSSSMGAGSTFQLTLPRAGPSIGA